VSQNLVGAFRLSPNGARYRRWNPCFAPLGLEGLEGEESLEPQGRAGRALGWFIAALWASGFLSRSGGHSAFTWQRLLAVRRLQRCLDGSV
jgi:hypothetical protein